MSKSEQAEASMKNVLAKSLNRAGEAPAAISAVPPNHRIGVTKSGNAMDIEIGRIVGDPGQPRTEYIQESLERMADSLKRRGQIQPLRVRWDAELDRYVIITGERRWRAAAMAGLATLACVVHEGQLSEGERRAIQLTENTLREDLRPMDQAKAIQALMIANGWTAGETAANLSLTHSTVSRALSLLDTSPTVQGLLEQGDLNPTAAYEISKLPSADDQNALATEAVENGLTNKEVATKVREQRSGPAAKSRGSTGKKQRSQITVREFEMEEGTVQVRVKGDSADPETQVAMLEKALKSARKDLRKNKAA